MTKKGLGKYRIGNSQAVTARVRAARAKKLSVKCPVCGRDPVEVTKKGYLGPHLQPSGLRCHNALVLDKKPPPAITRHELSTLRSISENVKVSYSGRSKTIASLELRGYIRCWPGEPPVLTDAGKQLLETERSR